MSKNSIYKKKSKMNNKNISESRVIIENGKIKTILSEEIQNNGGWMTIEESRRLCHEAINKRRELLNQRNGSINT